MLNNNLFDLKINLKLTGDDFFFFVVIISMIGAYFMTG